MKVENIEIEKLIPYEFNNKIHNETQINRIANSIKEFGFLQPVVIDANNIIIVGHGRVEGAKKLGLKEVPCIRAENLTETQIKKYRILDNKLNESAWDVDALKVELDELGDLNVGDIELKPDELFEDLLIDDEEEKAVEEDEAPEVQKEAKMVRGGDLFLLGKHRLFCGDSTKRDDVEKLMNGEKADLLLTDPPYNADYEGGNGKKIMNDKMENDAFGLFIFDAFTNGNLALKDGGCFYVRYTSREVINFKENIEKAGLSVKQDLIRNKNSLVIGRQDYQQKHEPCLYGWKETGPHKRYSDRKQTTIIDFDRPSRSEDHPTMKPIGLFDYQIKNSSKKGDVVLDLFLGSGTTMIACEQNGRICYGMELDPIYCEVILKRFHKLNPEAEIKCLNRDLDLNQLRDENK